jgi:hypothetical protein
MATLEPGPRGEPVTLAGDDPLALTGSSPAWHVVSGSLALFALETGNGASGRRQFLFNVGRDEILFGADPTDLGRTLMAVPTEASTVLPLTASELMAHGRLIHGIESWCANVARLLSAFAVPEEAKSVPVSGEAVAGKALYWPDPQPGWVRLVSGSASVVAVAGDIAVGSIVPMSQGVWLGASHVFKVERVSSETAAREIRMETIQAFSGILLPALREIDRRKESEARLRIDQRRQLEGRMGAAALVDLSGAKPQQSVLPELPLLAAARVVAENLGLVVRALGES